MYADLLPEKITDIVTADTKSGSHFANTTVIEDEKRYT
jgi:hypothetical protein